MKNTENYSFIKHALIVIAVLLLFNLLNIFLPFGNEASSIGIIGGADGPTTIFLPINMRLYLARHILIPVVVSFIAGLLLYKPIKNFIERNK